MNFREAIKQIESYEFSARLNIASDFNTFLKIAQQEAVVKIILDELNDSEKRLFMLEHIFELANESFDLRYENKWDTALAIYIWLLNLKDLKLSRIAADSVIRIPQCWWANKISQQICFEKITYASASKPVVESEVISSTPLPTTNIIKEAEEILLTVSLVPEICREEGLRIIEASTRFNDKIKYDMENLIMPSSPVPEVANFINTNCALI